MSDITLSSAMRSNLLSLQNTAKLIDRTSNRLNTQLAVSSPVDDAVKYFQAKSLNDRAADLDTRKKAVDQGVSALEAALHAADALEDLVNQMKGIIDTARSGNQTQRAEYSKQIKDLGVQIEKLVIDTTYQGLNLLNSTSSKLEVRFSEKTDSKLTVDGVDFNSSAFFMHSGGAAIGATAVNVTVAGDVVVSILGFGTFLSAFNFDNASQLASFNAMADLAVTRLDATKSNLTSKAASMATNVAILQVRADFMENYIKTLEGGATKLVGADMNEEGANLLALQTRQGLGIQSLSFAGQAEAAIQRIFG